MKWLLPLGLLNLFATWMMNQQRQKPDEVLYACHVCLFIVCVVSNLSHSKAWFQAGSKIGRGCDEGTQIRLLSIYNPKELSVDHWRSAHVAFTARCSLVPTYLYWGMMMLPSVIKFICHFKFLSALLCVLITSAKEEMFSCLLVSWFDQDDQTTGFSVVLWHYRLSGRKDIRLIKIQWLFQ